ncbi:MAG: tetrathionate reductase family octaheme c-type cytochrome [Actinomycetota bacterium]|nr:tetrathionate reductase family octaheme c-type cytochrome [Actinomycetota bacterium]
MTDPDVAPAADAESKEPTEEGSRRDWIIGLIAIVLLIVGPIVIFAGVRSSVQAANIDDPWTNVPTPVPHTDHSQLMTGPYETGPEVTEACLECHAEAGEDMLHSEHWLWVNPPVNLPGRDEPVVTGKANTINNFCTGIQGNEPKCTSCHAGYGWEDETFDFTDETKIDCLVCHDQSGQYGKADSGYPAEATDLAVAAQSVGRPTRANCGSCHFTGGGGNGVKHGDLDNTMIHPDQTIDYHMGELDFDCVDCHQATDHEIPGTMTSVKLVDDNPVACTDCHDSAPHEDDRLDSHTDRVACETCHIPTYAVKDPTKLWWDWSTAGQDGVSDDPHEYLKIKGSFVYGEQLIPEYFWFDGTAERYLLGDPIDPDGVTALNDPNGDINDPVSRIYPFKVHRANQPYDSVNNYFIQPHLAGPDGYWTIFDWDIALTQGAADTDMEYSGEYGFARSDMYWPLEHQVTSADQALQCTACHSDDGRLDWAALGYDGDPMDTAGRRTVTGGDE